MQNPISRFLAVMLGAISFCATARAADQPGYEISGYTFNGAGGQHFTVGYTFTLSRAITIDALGAIDFGGSTIATSGPFPVAMYYSASTPVVGTDLGNGHFSGDPVPGATASVSSTDPILALNGTVYTSGDGFRYHTLSAPLTLAAGTYELVSAELGTGFAQTWTGTVRAGGVGTPQTPVFSSTPTDLASYQIDPATVPLPGLAGPNFLVSVPEPASVGIFVLIGLGLGRRRRVMRSDACGVHRCLNS